MQFTSLTPYPRSGDLEKCIRVPLPHLRIEVLFTQKTLPTTIRNSLGEVLGPSQWLPHKSAGQVSFHILDVIRAGVGVASRPPLLNDDCENHRPRPGPLLKEVRSREHPSRCQGVQYSIAASTGANFCRYCPMVRD